MKTLENALESYFGTRRALGFRLDQSERLLRQFVAFLKTKQSDYVTTDLALEFSKNCRATPTRWARRLGTIRLFCRYVHAIDPRTELPPDRIFHRGDSRARPYIFSEKDIYRLVEACKAITLGELRNATYSTLLGLLAVTGMRVGEAIKLEDRVMAIEYRLTCIDASIKNLVAGFEHRLKNLGLDIKDVAKDIEPINRAAQGCRELGVPVIWIRSHHPKNGGDWRHFFDHFVRPDRADAAAAHLSADAWGSQFYPEMDVLRHSFAVNTLIRWYREGDDVEQRLPLLSTYMGHISPNSTYWYLSAVPELMQLAASRLEKQMGGVA